MKTLMIILLLSSNICLAKTYSQCLNDIKGTVANSYTENQFTEMITRCNIVILEGFNHKDKIKKVETKILVSTNPEIYAQVFDKKSFREKTDSLFMYEYCVDISSTISQYIKKCLGE